MTIDDIIKTYWGNDPVGSIVGEECKAIQKNCGQFLTIARAEHCLLWRGTHDSENQDLPIFNAMPPKFRELRGQQPILQQYMDFILRNAGFESIRSNSICVDSSEGRNTMFGKSYMIFPHDGFTFTWSSKISDIGSSTPLYNFLLKLIKKKKEGLVLGKPASGHRVGLESWPVEYYSPKSTRFDKRLSAQRIATDPPLTKEECIAYAEELGFRNDDLKAALESEHEITIHGEYTGIEAKYKTLVRDLLKI